MRARSRGSRRRVVPLIVACILAIPFVGGGSAPDVGRVFDPKPLSAPLYAYSSPQDAPSIQRHFVTASDGAQIFVETWLPSPKDGNIPPSRLPTVLMITPYATVGRVAYPERLGIEVLKRGFAYSQMHVRGTGKSQGCSDQIGPLEVDDAARVIEYLGRDAPWSDGTVGTFGGSYEGGSQIAVAAKGNTERIKYLKAIVPLAPSISKYEFHNFDGVPGIENLGYAVLWPRDTFRCLSVDVLTSWSDPSGDVNAYFAERDSRAFVSNITAATLLIHGTPDRVVHTIQDVGLFERLPASTPKAGLFGIFGHSYPDEHAIAGFERADFIPMVVAWYDRYLKGLDTGVDGWPTVQVQGTDGQWRAEPEWPTTGGPVGHLGLGRGALGTSVPTGSSSYIELYQESTDDGGLPGTELIFKTGPMPARLEITGQPVLDLWVMLNRPDAHIVAEIVAYTASGDRINGGFTQGARSMRHLDPLVENRFAQSLGKPAPVGVPIRVTVRFNPADIVVPAGGRLFVYLNGGRIFEREERQNYLWTDETVPSLSFSRVTILHDCEHPSALRFLMPRPNPDLLNVREFDETGSLSANPLPSPPISDGGGIASAPLCGAKPIRMENFGPPIAYAPPE